MRAACELAALAAVPVMEDLQVVADFVVHRAARAASSRHILRHLAFLPRNRGWNNSGDSAGNSQ